MLNIKNILTAVALVMVASASAWGVDKVIRSDMYVEATATFWSTVTIGDSAADTVTITSTIQGASPLVFEGATANAYETTFAITDPTTDRTITFPNSTGTVALNPYGESIEFEGATADAYETTLTVTDPTADRTVTIPNASGTLFMSGADMTFVAALSGGADISIAAAAADTAGDTLDIVAGAGGTAGADQVGRNGGAVTITGAAGSAKNGSGATDGNGGDVVLLGGAKGGSTGGSEVDGIVRIGSPTVNGTKATNMLAVGGALEVDGAIVLGTQTVTNSLQNPGRAAFKICGEGTTINNNTVYYGPNLTLVATDDGLTCDINAVGNTTEATVDEPIFSAAVHVLGMVCRNEADANADVSFTLRTAAGATTPSVTCTIADNARYCVADVQTTTAIGSGATVAIAAASTGDIGDNNGFVCTVYVAY